MNDLTDIGQALKTKAEILESELSEVNEELEDYKDMHKKDTVRIKELESALRKLLEL